MECIVLAGGLGTRLRSSIGEAPKCMAPVNGQPFLHYLFLYLAQQGCSRVLLSLGYKSEAVISWISELECSFEIDFVIEEAPLGTGGGIQLALHKCAAPHVAVLNGDTFFNIDLRRQFLFHKEKKSATTLALKTMRQYDRYGTVHTDISGCIRSFEEKKYTEQGCINAGVYVIDRNMLLSKQLPEKYSFEKDYLETYVHEQRFYGLEQEGYFIDIGIPQDYDQAQEDFKHLFS